MKIAFDTETRGLDWWDEDQRAFLASWADERNEYVANLLDAEGLATFEQAMRDATTVVAHNLPFDVHQTRETTGLDVLATGAELYDTDIMSRVLYPEGQRKGERGGHGLKNLASVWLRADADEAEKVIAALAKEIGYRTIKTTGAYFDVWRAYPEQMEHYAKQDARYTYDLHTMFERELGNNPALAKCYELERTVQPVLIRAEERGVALDQDAVLRVRRQFYEQQATAREYLERELGEEALGGQGSDAALIESLQRIGVPLYRKTDTGQLSTNKFALQEFEDDYPQLAILSEFRQASKFLNTYLEPMVGREVIHTSFMQCAAWTGRMSSRRPNMQNIPVRAGSEVRSVLVPREGHSFVVCDYDSIEVRLLAWYLGDPGFRSLIEDGHDPHAWMAANIHGGEMAEYLKGTDGEKLRAAAKNTLFAITYGAGAPRVSDMNQISKDEAKALISKIKGSLPNYYRLMKRVREKIEDVGYVNTLMGRKNPVMKEKSYVGLNALIQGSAADVMKQGLVNVDEAVADLGATPLLVVHDEVVIECPTEYAQECLERTEQALCAAYPLSPSLAVSGGIYHNSYAEAK